MIDLEPICRILIKYFLDYLRKKQTNDREDEEPILSSNQVLILLESLLTVSIESPFIDLKTIVTVLTSCKIPQITTNKSNDSIKNSEQIDYKFKMNNLVKSFLNQSSFTHKNQSIETTECLVSTKTSKDLFTYYSRKYFHSYNGLRIVLNECETNLTYLNAYRKNHLKQLLNTNQEQLSNNKSLSFNLIEEAVQAKANCSNLINDLDYFYKFISLPIFNFVIDNELDKQFIEQITNLVLAAQIATLITCSADLILTSQETLTKQLTDSSFLCLAKKSLAILDQYFQLIPCHLTQNSNVETSFIISYYLNKILQHQKLSNKNQQQDSLNIVHLTSELNLFTAKLISMLNIVFTETKSNNTVSLQSFKDFNLFSNYSNNDLFNLFITNQFKLFPFLFNLLRVSFSKCHSIYSTIQIVKPPLVVAESIIEPNEPIKNIDDPSSDEESNQTKEQSDDSDDYYMIRNLFEDHSVNEIKQQQKVILPISEEIKSDCTSTLNRSGVVSSSDATQILDTTFELDQTNTQAAIVLKYYF